MEGKTGPTKQMEQKICFLFCLLCFNDQRKSFVVSTLVSTQCYEYPFLPVNLDQAPSIDLLHLKNGYFKVLVLPSFRHHEEAFPSWNIVLLKQTGARSPFTPALWLVLVTLGLSLPPSAPTHVPSHFSLQCCPGLVFFMNILLGAHRAFWICVLMYFINNQCFFNSCFFIFSSPSRIPISHVRPFLYVSFVAFARFCIFYSPPASLP